MTQIIRERLFLVGCPRSGTTLLQSLLAAHSQVASFPESHFLAVNGKSQWAYFCMLLGLVSSEMTTRVDEFLLEIERPDMKSRLPKSAFLLRPYTAAFVNILDQLALHQGNIHWLEKTPGHLHYIKQLERYVKGAKFIHILRNGADVVASMYEYTNKDPQAWGGKYSIDQCIERWNGDIQRSQKHVGKKNHAFVRYEELVTQPEAILSQLCDFIGLPFEATMLTEYRTTADHLILPHETWKNPVKQSIRSTNGTKFKRVFNHAQQDYIWKHLKPIESSSQL